MPPLTAVPRILATRSVLFFGVAHVGAGARPRGNADGARDPLVSLSERLSDPLPARIAREIAGPGRAVSVVMVASDADEPRTIIRPVVIKKRVAELYGNRLI